jgi:hypothetical protein
MKAELIINNVRLELGHKELNEISYTLDDCKKAKDIFHELAQSPSTETRSNIVSQKNLHRKTVRLLLSDSQIEVMRSMIRKDKFISQMGKDDIERFLNSGDSEILTEIVDNISDLTEVYELCEKDWLCEKLYQQADPTVRYALAENAEASEFILKKLLEDSDINVAETAKETLEEIESDNIEDEDDGIKWDEDAADDIDD